MPELYIKVRELFLQGKMKQAGQLQNEICRIIYRMCEAHGNLYAVLKEVIRLQGGPDVGGVREPLAQLAPEDHVIAKECADRITEAVRGRE